MRKSNIERYPVGTKLIARRGPDKLDKKIDKKNKPVTGSVVRIDSGDYLTHLVKTSDGGIMWMTGIELTGRFKKAPETEQ